MVALRRITFFLKYAFQSVCLCACLVIPAKGQNLLYQQPNYAVEHLHLATNYVPLSFITPSVKASSQDICPNDFVSFMAFPVNANSYSWYINGEPIGITTSTFGTTRIKDKDEVTCYVTDASGGAFAAPLIFKVGDNRPPSISITATSVNICKGTQVTFSILDQRNQGDNPVYQWKVNDAIVGTGPTYTSSTFQNFDQLKCVLISNAKCIAPTPVTSSAIGMNVSDIAKPAGKIIATAKNFCQGSSIDFTMNMSVGEPVSYQWKINGINVSTNSTFNSANLADQDVISCDMVVNTQCSTGIPFSPVDYMVSVIPYADAGVSITSSTQNGVCAGIPITFTAVATANAGNDIKYQWLVNDFNAGANSNIFTSSALHNNDVVTCKITPQNIPCLISPTVGSNPVTVKVFTAPVVTLPAIQKIITGSSIILLPIITGDASSYLWSPATGLSSTNEKNPTASPIVNTTYTLTVTSPDGCTATTATTIKLSGGVINIKNTFTPNGDGVNDKWEIPNLINYADCSVAIFNRYGTKVYNTIGYLTAWDGKLNNNPLPQGVYYYIIDLKDGSKPLSGSVAIIR